MLTERLKRLFSQQASGIDYAILLAPIPVIGYLISLANLFLKKTIGEHLSGREVSTNKNTLIPVALWLIQGHLQLTNTRY